MKKFIAIIALVLCLILVGCDAEIPESPANDTLQSEVDEPIAEVVPDTTENTEEVVVEEETEVEEPVAEEDVESVNLSEYKQGDAVSIVGQVAGSVLINGNTLWVQVQQSDGSFVIYHCQMKQEFIEAAESLKMLDVVKVDGLFLSYFDSEMENTSPIVTLYDCEIK